DEEDRLVVGRIEGRPRDLVEVEGAQLGARLESTELAEGRQQARAHDLAPPRLEDDAELEGVPAGPDERVELVVGRDERRLPEQAVDARELAVGEERRVTDELVDDVRLGRVERQAVVPDVLRREEAPGGELAHEPTWRDQSGDRRQDEAGGRAEHGV